MEETSSNPGVHGIHHVTVIAGDPQDNIDFYTQVMGMRLVKKSINQDSPDTYHFFYADAVGSPGTDLTFFPWPGLPRTRNGYGQIVEVSFAVKPGSLKYWQIRLQEMGVELRDVEFRFGELTLPFEDPHGLGLALVETTDQRDFTPWAESPVPVEHQLMGMHCVRLWEKDLEPSEVLLENILGFKKIGDELGWHRFGVGDVSSGKLVELMQSDVRGSGGTGGIHHVAWRVTDTAEEMALREAIHKVGLQPTSQIDRFWFKSVYFREPGGALYELATDGPGFTVDESLSELGSSLVLPPWMEKDRKTIEAGLPPVTTP